MERIYDVIIIGAGVSGSAQALLLSKYTSIKKIAIFEKEKEAGNINSKRTHNSQTLHEGDIETNYSYKKAKEVHYAASFTRNYVLSKDDDSLRMLGPKMVMGVGKTEVNFIKNRFKTFKKEFPKMQLLTKEDIGNKEPMILKGRNKKIPLAALYSEQGLTIDYQNLSKTMLKDAKQVKNKTIDTYLNSKIKSLTYKKGKYLVKTTVGTFVAKTVVVAAGAHSLLFAKKLGYAKHLSLLSVAGNFYYSPKFIHTKTYTLQNDKLPFAAVHGDPDIGEPNKNRFGPTTNVVFMLERREYNTVHEYFKTFGFTFKALKSFYKILSDKTFFWYSLRHNVTFKIPFIGRHLFLKEIQKIIPTMKLNELKQAKGHGGVRPQIIDTNHKNKPLQLGEAKLEGEKILFNVTPSPGASTCIYNAYQDTFKIMKFLEKETFDEKKFLKDFKIKK